MKCRVQLHHWDARYYSHFMYYYSERAVNQRRSRFYLSASFTPFPLDSIHILASDARFAFSAIFGRLCWEFRATLKVKVQHGNAWFFFFFLNPLRKKNSLTIALNFVFQSKSSQVLCAESESEHHRHWVCFVFVASAWLVAANSQPIN